MTLSSISRLPTADSLSSLLTVPLTSEPRRSTVSLVEKPSLLSTSRNSYYAPAILKLVKHMQAKSILDKKAHLGMIPLKKLAQMKN